MKYALELWATAFSFPRNGSNWPMNSDEQQVEQILQERESSGDGWARHNAILLGSVDYLSESEVARRQQNRRDFMELVKKLHQRQDEKFAAEQAARKKQTPKFKPPNQVKDTPCNLIIGHTYKAEVSYRLSKNTDDLAMIDGELVEIIGVRNGDLVKITSHKRGKAYGHTFVATGEVGSKSNVLVSVKTLCHHVL